MLDAASTAFFDILPLPILLGKSIPEGIDHPHIYINPAFEQQIGWTLEDIPDKAHWWQCAYPDTAYQQVVARQWELSVETAIQEGLNTVVMEVNIQTKHRGLQRFKVSSQLIERLLPGYFVVLFEPHE